MIKNIIIILIFLFTLNKMLTIKTGNSRIYQFEDSQQCDYVKKDEIIGYVKEASKKYQIPESLVWSLIECESFYDRLAVSSAGAKGLMQLVDKTAKEVGVKNVFNARDNIIGGCKYLDKCLKIHNGRIDMAIASYYAGPYRIKKLGYIPDYCKEYVLKVLKRAIEIQKNGGY